MTSTLDDLVHAGKTSPIDSPTSNRAPSVDSRSSTSTKPSSCDGSPVVRTSTRGSGHGKAKHGSWHQSLSSNLIFCPRPYEEIYAEQAYLTRSLQMQSVKAAELLNRYTLIHEELDGGNYTGKRRNARKHLNSLKLKITAASQQERSIIIRLSELHMELQSRDAWGRVQQRRRMSATSTCSPTTATSESSVSSATSSKTSLNAASLEFVPSGAFVGQPCSVSQTEPTSVITGLKTVEENGEDRDDDEDIGEGDELCNNGLEYTYQVSEQSETPRSHEGASHSLREPTSCRGERRQSLPGLISVWPSA